MVVASNQSGVGRGLFSMEALEGIHAKLRAAVETAGGTLAGIFFCPHTPDDNCDCRKPKPGLLRQIAEKFDCELKGVPAVGDSARDLEAAIAVGAEPILVRTGNGRETERSLPEDSEVRVFEDLRAAASDIIETRGPK